VSNWLPAAAVPIANRPGLDRTAFDGNQPSCELRGRRGSVWYGRRASGGGLISLIVIAIAGFLG